MSGPLALVIIKPEIHLNRGVGRLLTRIEEAGFSILLCKLIQIRKEGAEEFYKEHQNKPGYLDLVKALLIGPSWVLVISKTNVLEEFHNLLNALPEQLKNHIHCSEHDWASKKEINFFFNREIRIAQEIEKLNNKQ